MKRRTSIINTAITFIITIGFVILATLLCNSNYVISSAFLPVLFYAIGAIVWGLFNSFLHEAGHIVACKKNGFYILEVSVWFFKWTRVKKRMRFDFTLIGEEAGYTESVPVGTDNIEKRYRKTVLGGVKASFIALLMGIGVMFTVGRVPYQLYCVFSMLLPISAYFFFGNILPMVNGGEKNDGAVYFGLKKNDISTQVMLSLLKVQAELMSGKTFCEIDEKLYFDLPQLPEDDLNFIRLLNARYNYYLDKEDFENAKKTADRLYGLIDDLPKNHRLVVMSDVLYNCCTFDYNEDLADDLMSDVEKYLNAVNTATNVRIKLAYLLYVKKSSEYAREIYDWGVKLSKRTPINGIGVFENKLLSKIEKDISSEKSDN